jgi:hypothetical protein
VRAGLPGGEADQERLLQEAKRLEQCGCFSLVLEGIPSRLGAQVSRELTIPTIGIGAGPDCDGQILVLSDMLGLTFGSTPKFSRPYANVAEIISSAVRAACEQTFECYHCYRIGNRYQNETTEINNKRTTTQVTCNTVFKGHYASVTILLTEPPFPTTLPLGESLHRPIEFPST